MKKSYIYISAIITGFIIIILPILFINNYLKNINEIISRDSKNNIQLKVIDVRKHPQLAEDDKILAVPTLIKKLPPPVRKIIGDLSDKEKVLLGLDLILQK